MKENCEKLAILHCKKSSRICTGAACFQAYHQRTRAFERYRDRSVELWAFFDCGGCEVEDPAADPYIKEKLERLRREGVSVIHVGICMCDHIKKDGSYDPGCGHYGAFKSLMESYGFTVVAGTH